MLSTTDIGFYAIGAVILFLIGMLFWSSMSKIFDKKIRFSSVIALSLYTLTIGISGLFLFWGSVISSSYIRSDSTIIVDNLTLQIANSSANSPAIYGDIVNITADIHAKTSSFDTGIAIIGIGLTFVLFSLTMIYTILNQDSSYAPNEHFISKNLYFSQESDYYSDNLNLRFERIQEEIKKFK